MSNLRSVKRLMLFLLSLWFSTILCAQDLQVVCAIPVEITECSGMCPAVSSAYWMLNDGGNPAELYLVDTSGTVLRTLTISNLSNVDWESLASDDSGNIYIGDFGNNDNNRSNLRIGRINAQDLPRDTVDAEIIDFAYEDQLAFPPARSDFRFDCEAMFLMGDSIYLITKNWTNPFTGMAYLYSLPKDMSDSQARLQDSAYLGDNSFLSQVTDCVILDDKLLMLGYGGVWVCRKSGSDIHFSDPKYHSFGGVRQFEAIASEDSVRFLIAEEAMGGNANMYRFRLDRSAAGVEGETLELELQYVESGLILHSLHMNFHSVTLMDIGGRLIYESESGKRFVPITKTGIYLLTVSTDRGIIRRKIAWQ